MELKCCTVLIAKRTERFIIRAHRRSSVVELSFVNPSKGSRFEWRDNKSVYRIIALLVSTMPTGKDTIYS